MLQAKRMNTSPCNEIELLCDRVNDLESRVIELSEGLPSSSNNASSTLCKSKMLIGLTIPLFITIFILMGISINYQTETRQISYNNNNLFELGLSCLTIISGAYSLKKHSEQSRL